jgi:hypothetical protein
MSEIEFDENVEGENLDIGEEPEKPGKIPREMAEKEFQSWAEHLRLDTDLDEMDAEEKADFLQLKKKFVYNLMHRITHTEDNGDLVLNLIEPVAGNSTMIFRKKFKGSAFVAMDRYKDSQHVHKTLAFLAAWTKWNPKHLTQLDAVDTWFGMKMVSLFFGA